MFTLLARRFIAGLALGLAALLATLPLATPVEAGWRSLTGRLPAHADILDVIISPDSRYAVFSADIEMDERYELYSVPITGSMPLKLNPPLIAAGEVHHFKLTPDSKYVIYTAKQEAGESDSDLYRVPIGGGPAVKLNVFYLSGRNVRNFKIDRDNVRVVYEAIQENDEILELFSVPIAGGTAIVKLNPSLVAGGDVDRGFAIDPFFKRVVYLADQEVDNRYELYGVPIAGGQALKLNPPGSTVIDFALNPQAPAVAFRAWPGGSYTANLYMNVTSGGLLTPLNYPLASNERVIGFGISPDGTQVVYNVAVGTSTNPTPAYGNLYSVPTGGGDSTLLTTSADPGYGVSLDDFIITPDGQRVVFRFQRNAMAGLVLESVAMNGGSRATLRSLGADERYSSYFSSPDSQWAIFTPVSTFQMYAIPAAGGASVPLGVGSFSGITPDSSRVIFTSYNQPPFDLYSVPISGGEAGNLSRIGDQAEVRYARISPDGRWIVFHVKHKTGNTELRVSDGAGAQPTSTLAPVYLPIIMR